MPGANFHMLLSKGGSRTETLVDRTTGTNIGTFTGNGGLASVFDGNTSQSYTVSGVHTGTDGYVGKTHGAAKICSRVICYGANDLGFSSVNNSCTLELYGKNGAAPSSSTDGTLLGSVTFTDTSNESAGRTITSSDQSTAYTHWFVRVTSTANLVMTELVMYEMV